MIIKQTPYSEKHPYYRTHMIKIAFVNELKKGEKINVK